MLTDSVWAKLTPSELWGKIRTEAENYYHYTIDGCVFLHVCVCGYLQKDFFHVNELNELSFSVFSDSMDEVIGKHSLQRISLLRELALKTGIQVRHLSCLNHHTLTYEMKAILSVKATLDDIFFLPKTTSVLSVKM